VEHRSRCEDKVIARLDLDLAVAFGAGRSAKPAIRGTRAENESGCGGRGSQHQHQRQGCQETD
jgi:hypothetical protein